MNYDLHGVGDHRGKAKEQNSHLFRPEREKFEQKRGRNTKARQMRVMSGGGENAR